MNSVLLVLIVRFSGYCSFLLISGLVWFGVMILWIELVMCDMNVWLLMKVMLLSFGLILVSMFFLLVCGLILSIWFE